MNWKKKEYWLVIGLLSVTAIYAHLIRADQVEVAHSIELDKMGMEFADWQGQEQFLTEDVLKSA